MAFLERVFEFKTARKNATFESLSAGEAPRVDIVVVVVVDDNPVDDWLTAPRSKVKVTVECCETRDAPVIVGVK